MKFEDDIHYLKYMNEIYKNILEEINEGIQVIDCTGHTIVYNKKKMSIESMDSKDVLYKDLLEVFKFKSKEDSRLLQALEKGIKTNNSKQTYFNNKGKEITTINNTYPIINNGKVIAAVEIANDITKFEQLKKSFFKTGNTKYTFESIIGESKVLKEVIERGKRATRTTSSILIVGETGTGKELFAQSIHHGSHRSNMPFVSQNCAALPDNLVESLLFGTKKGAFTGAIDQPGLLEQAEGGTLLLDEINSLNPTLQAKLLRAIQEKVIRRVGDTKDKVIDVRIIATMNEAPLEAISNNRLRNDLYYRLSVVSLFVPPLRDRKEDIPLLARKFIEKYNHLFQLNVQDLSQEVYNLFYEYNWPGNVRELEHVIEGAMNLIMNEVELDYYHLPHHFVHKSQLINKQSKGVSHDAGNDDLSKSLKDYLEEVEANYLKRVLTTTKNNVSHSANILGISRQSLQYRLRKYEINEKH